MDDTDELKTGDLARPISRWRVAMRLLGGRQRAIFALHTVARSTVGIFDLAIAAVMYLLFLRLQGRVPLREVRWIPVTVLGTALLGSILVVLRSLLDMASSRTVFRSIQNLYVDFLLRLASGYNEMSWTKFVARNRNELLHHALHTAREGADFYHRCIEFAAGSVIVAITAAAFVYQSPSAALAFGFLLAVTYSMHRYFIRKIIYQAASNREESLTRLQKAVANLFSAGKEIRTYGIQSLFGARIRSEAEAFSAQHRRAVFLPQVSRIIAEQGTVLLFLALIVAVALQDGDTRRLLSVLAFYFVLSRRLLPLISQMSLIAGQMESSYEYVRTLDTELAACRNCRTPISAPQLPRPGHVLELSHVHFWFHKNTPVLRDINLVLRQGEIVVLHGASGIGKSSLLNLIAGILAPITGTVRVDPATIAYVPQEIFLLDDSIRNNLLFGLRTRRDEELMHALAAANLADFVSAQPAGLETRVGDNGALLSGGQRQRLGLARAILRGSHLLLLDEATAAFDPETERQVLANLRACGAAILLVTHRRHTYALGQRVYHLCDGILIEEPASVSGTNQNATWESTISSVPAGM